jgi:hypothetical protein
MRSSREKKGKKCRPRTGIGVSQGMIKTQEERKSKHDVIEVKEDSFKTE